MSVEVIKENINALCRLLKDDLPPVRNAAGSCIDQLVSMRDGEETDDQSSAAGRKGALAGDSSQKSL